MRAALALALATLLTACSQPARNVLVADRGGFRVALPEGWEGRATDPGEWADRRTVAIVASQPLDPQCDASGCTAPVASLDDGAILLWWLSENCAGGGCELPNGDPLLVGGRQATQVGGSHLCDALGATSETAYIVTVTPQRLEAIVVCGRNASDELTARAQDLLEHVGWRVP
ncbi:MAG TPA: hypothetical protein VF153_01885 [Candidatus Limnocylindria bacterium]